MVMHILYGLFGNAFRYTVGAGFLVLLLLPLTANAAPHGCNPKIAAVSTASDAVAHYEMTMSAALAASLPANATKPGLRHSTPLSPAS
mgnify:CR=1 FL=1